MSGFRCKLSAAFCELDSFMTSAKYILNLSVLETSPVVMANCCVYYNGTVSKVQQHHLRVEQQCKSIVRTEQKQEHITRALILGTPKHSLSPHLSRKLPPSITNSLIQVNHVLQPPLRLGLHRRPQLH